MKRVITLKEPCGFYSNHGAKNDFPPLELSLSQRCIDACERHGLKAHHPEAKTKRMKSNG